jgi:KipI family sensor histidine kinase inhibitor
LTTTRLRAHPLGDSAVTVVFGSERSPELLRRIHSAARSLAAANIPHVHDIVPAYLALTAYYDSLQTNYDELAARLLDACERDTSSDENIARSHQHRIPVRYDGVDLETVAAATRLSREEVIALHSARTYAVDLLGFVPGFAYLSELDAALQLPRRPQPRPRVAAGSVAIAAAQTAVYPLDTPGGWHIIGTTQTVLFDATRGKPALLSPGDTVRFEPIP